MYRFQLEFLCEGPLFFWHDALPLDALFQVYTLRESPSSPFSHTYDTCTLFVCDHEYCYFLPRFGLLHNTTHWGKIEGTRSLVLCLFSYSKHANGRIVFQVLLPFSPVRGELPVEVDGNTPRYPGTALL